MIKKNVGAKDKKARLTAAAVLILVGLFLNLGALESVMFLVAVILVVTSLLNFCPAYSLMGKNTCGVGDKTEKKAEQAE